MKYLLITMFRKAGGQIDEQVTVSKRIKPADIQTCNVIMNYASKNIEKCVIEGKVIKSSWENLNEYYKKHYPELIAQLEADNSNAVQV